MQDEQIIFLSNKVQGKLKKGTTLISRSYPLYESYIALFLHEPSLVRYFAEGSTYDKMVEFQKINRDHLGEIFITLNNYFQKVHFSDQGNQIRIKEVVDKIKNSLNIDQQNAEGRDLGDGDDDVEEKETIEIRNLILNGLSRIFDTFNRVTFKRDNINLTSLKDHQDEQLKVSRADIEKLSWLEKLTDRYFKAQNALNKLSADKIKSFLDADVGRYDPYYSVQEMVLFLLKSIYNVDFKMQTIADKPLVKTSSCLDLLFGIPIFSLDNGQRNMIFNWYQQRNWPLKSEMGYYNESHKKTIKIGFEIFQWAKEMIQILKKLDEMEKMDSNINKNVMQDTEIVNKVESEHINWAYLPFNEKAAYSIIKINSLYEGYSGKPDIIDFVKEAFDLKYDAFEESFNKEYLNPSTFIFDVAGFTSKINFPQEFTLRGESFFPDDFEISLFEKKFRLFGYVVMDEVNGGDVFLKSEAGEFESVVDKEERKIVDNDILSVVYVYDQPEVEEMEEGGQ